MIPTKQLVHFANRVAKTEQRFETISFLLVRTHENPADFVTKPIKTRELINFEFWREGPNWVVFEPNHFLKHPELLDSAHIRQSKRDCSDKNLMFVENITVMLFKLIAL